MSLAATFGVGFSVVVFYFFWSEEERRKICSAIIQGQKRSFWYVLVGGESLPVNVEAPKGTLPQLSAT